MADITEQKVGQLSLMDGFLIGASKLTTEQVMQSLPYVGGTSFVSGFSKVGLAIGISMLTKNKWAQIVQTGILLDGVEDIFVTAKAKWFNKNSDNASDVGEMAFSSAFAQA